MGGQRHTPAALPPGEKPGTHCIGGWVGPRAGLDGYGKSRPTGIRSPDRPARSELLCRLCGPAPTAVSYFPIILLTLQGAAGHTHRILREILRTVWILKAVGQITGSHCHVWRRQSHAGLCGHLVPPSRCEHDRHISGKSATEFSGMEIPGCACFMREHARIILEKCFFRTELKAVSDISLN